MKRRGIDRRCVVVASSSNERVHGDGEQDVHAGLEDYLSVPRERTSIFGRPWSGVQVRRPDRANSVAVPLPD